MSKHEPAGADVVSWMNAPTHAPYMYLPLHCPPHAHCSALRPYFRPIHPSFLHHFLPIYHPYIPYYFSNFFHYSPSALYIFPHTSPHFPSDAPYLSLILAPFPSSLLRFPIPSLPLPLPFPPLTERPTGGYMYEQFSYYSRKFS